MSDDQNKRTEEDWQIAKHGLACSRTVRLTAEPIESHVLYSRTKPIFCVSVESYVTVHISSCASS